MTEEQISKLFNAFEQADTSISRRFGGTGLGLAISKNIVEKMGGKIWVDSEAGKGSSFTFEIELEHAAPNEKTCQVPDLNDMKILVASNDERICEYFKSVTSDYGVTTETATSADDMVSMVSIAYDAEKLYDMIFIDYNLRCNDIFDVVKKLHGQTEVGAIILMTSFLTWNKIDAKTRGASINRFISTPLFPSDILSCLRREDVKVNNASDRHEAAFGDVPDLSGVTLLLAEDVEINREIFKTLLEDTKVNIDSAENGLIAVEMYKQNPGKYDMIIMDVHMPEMDGYRATEMIRSMENDDAKTIPIIAMTANVFREDVEKCLACGMNDHLAKPIDDAEVKRKISIHLKLRA